MLKGYDFLIIGFMMAMNGVFAAYEMALASISRARLAVLVSQKKKGADEAAFMKDHMEASLAVIQVGITLFGAIAAATGGSSLADSLIPYLTASFRLPPVVAKLAALLILILPLSTLIIIFAELTPKTIALENRELVCLALSPFMKRLSRISYPIIRIIERIVKRVVRLWHKTPFVKKMAQDKVGLHELNAAASMARAARLIGARQEKIVLSIAQLSVRPVREIMIPVQDIFTIPLKSSLNDALLRAHLDLHTRFPVCEIEGDTQTIVGYVNFKDIIMALKFDQESPGFRSIVRPIKSVQAKTPVSQALEQMMQEKLHIALVASDKGEIIGMITLEDILEEMTGEIEDEFDRLPTHIHPCGNGWIVGGGITVEAARKTVGLPPANDDTLVSSIKLADWAESANPGPLQGAETIKKDGIQLIVRKMRRKRLAEAIISRLDK